MVKWHLLFSKRAAQDAKKLKAANLKKKAEKLLSILETDPFQNPPIYKKLVGDLEGYYSRRINIQHRLVYSINEKKRSIRVIAMFGHYK